MRLLRLSVALVSTLAAPACQGVIDPGVCTGEFVYGLNVQVQDSSTGAWIASGATLVARDGAFVDSVTAPANRPQEDHFPLLAAGERPGTYEVLVRREGYRPWSRSGVQVRRGTCHVERVHLIARLQIAAEPLPTGRGA